MPKRISRLAPFARAVVRQAARIRENENVIIETWDNGLKAALEVLYECRRVGAKPLFVLEDEETWWRSVEGLPKGRTGRVGSHEWSALEEAKAYIFFPGPGDIARYRRLGMDRAMAATAYNSEWYRRAAKARVRGVRVLLGYVGEARAEAYGFNHKRWTEAVLQAGRVNLSVLSKKAKRLRGILKAGKAVRITAKNGTDLRFRLVKRDVFIDDGITDRADLDMKNNMADFPPGEVFMSISERSAEGLVIFDLPTPSFGTWVDGLQWTFENGRLVSHKVRRNKKLFEEPYARDRGDKDRLGGISIGLNPRMSRDYLWAGFSAGCVGLTLGGNTWIGGKNKSNFSFGGYLSRATVEVDGKAVVTSGRLRM
jgi:leucyl aminopeptidase (aminopeptidase T)